jgi:hypothetical protein
MSYVLPPAHSLCRRAVVAPHARDVTFHVSLSHPAMSYMHNHIVNGRAIFPGAGYLEMSAAAVLILCHGANTTVAFADVGILAPLVVPQDPTAAAAVGLRVVADTSLGQVTVCSGPAGGEADSSDVHSGGGKGRRRRGGSGAATSARKPTVHLTARVTRLGDPSEAASSATAAAQTAGGLAQLPPQPAPGARCRSRDALRAAAPTPLSVPAVYADLAAAGLRYGQAFRRLRYLHAASDAAVGSLRLPDREDHGAYLSHPSVLDSAFQLGAAIGAAGTAGTGKSAPSAPGAGAQVQPQSRTFVPVGMRLFCMRVGPGAEGGGSGGGLSPTATTASAEAAREVHAVASGPAQPQGDCLFRDVNLYLRRLVA